MKYHEDYDKWPVVWVCRECGYTKLPNEEDVSVCPRYHKPNFGTRPYPIPPWIYNAYLELGNIQYEFNLMGPPSGGTHAAVKYLLEEGEEAPLTFMGQ
jgi:hypothetical protein